MDFIPEFPMFDWGNLLTKAKYRLGVICYLRYSYFEQLEIDQFSHFGLK